MRESAEALIDDVVQIAVQGMHCAGCVAKIEKDLRAIDGVVQTSVNFATGNATVTYSPDPSRKESDARRDRGEDRSRPSNAADDPFRLVLSQAIFAGLSVVMVRLGQGATRAHIGNMQPRSNAGLAR